MTEDEARQKWCRPLHKWATRFWSKVEVDPSGSGCLLWIAGKSSTGYGLFWLNGKMRAAHRLAYESTFGPTESLVLHRCHNRACVNPAHLYDGTHSQNNRDAFAIGTGHKMPGESNPSAKLTESDVAEIRSSSEPTRKIGARYGISSGQVSRIRRGLNWAHCGLAGKL